MKKVISLLLTLILLLGFTTFTYADTYDNPTSKTTTVTYIGKGTEGYTVTVPATLAPAGSGDVTVSGTFASNRKVTVSCDTTVTLTNSINSSDTKTLNVTFDGITLSGSNTASVSETKTVSVADISDALFGTWSGTFNYTIAIANVS